MLRKELKLPDFRNYAVQVGSRGTNLHENTKPFGQFLRDVIKNNPTSFRVFGPDETASNRLQAVYEASKKTWMADMLPEDADGGELARDGRVMEMLSEHTLVGWLEGYLLTGRHGFFHTYEAFAHVIDSMFNQHAKWLDISKNHVPGARRWRRRTSCCHRPFGGRITTASLIRTRASSISSPTRARPSCASICRPTRTPCWP